MSIHQRGLLWPRLTCEDLPSHTSYILLSALLYFHQDTFDDHILSFLLIPGPRLKVSQSLSWEQLFLLLSQTCLHWYPTVPFSAFASSQASFSKLFHPPTFIYQLRRMNFQGCHQASRPTNSQNSRPRSGFARELCYSCAYLFLTFLYKGGHNISIVGQWECFPMF